MRLLAITGFAGSGKTTISNQLIDFDWKPTKFSTPLKSMIVQLLLYQGVHDNIAWRMIEGDLKEIPTEYLNGQTPRHAMQTLGTEWRETIHRNLWIDAWLRNIQHFPRNSKIIVDDLRFKHEAQIIRNNGGKIVQIHRPNNHQISSSTHLSETEMADIIPDATIINDAEPAKMLRDLQVIIGQL